MRLALANVVLAAFMTGVIWLVQLVVYPMFLDAGPSAFPAWETEHASRIAPVVGPAIAGQLLAGVALVITASDHARWPARLNLGLLVLAVGVTGLVSVPLHAELADGFSAATIDDLVQSNWIRTAAWTAQLAAALALLGRAGHTARSCPIGR